MPEGPEVEVVRKLLDPRVKDEKITGFEANEAGRKILRHMRFKKSSVDEALQQFLDADNRIIDGVSRIGKLLIFRIKNAGNITGDLYVGYFNLTKHDWFLTCNLGMSGKFFLGEVPEELQKHVHFSLKLENCILKYVDVRRFGLWRLFDTDQMKEHLKSLGVDGLDSSPKKITEVLVDVAIRMKKRPKKRTIKDILLDQSYVAGVGNIYASELCYDLKIDPRLPFDLLDELQIASLSENIVMMLNTAASNGGSSVRDYTGLDGKNGEQQKFLRVYGRSNKKCFNCSDSIRYFEQEGRRTFVCPTCQELIQ